MAHPPAPALIVGDAERRALQTIVRAPSSEQRAVTRARIVLRSADGAAIERIADELGVAIMTVKLRRRRYAVSGLVGLSDAPRPGHLPTFGREERDRLAALTLAERLTGTTHWSIRRIAPRVGMSPSTVHRISSELGLKPHRTETFKFTTAPSGGLRYSPTTLRTLASNAGSAVRRRDDPDPGARSHPAAADASRADRAAYP